MLRRALPVLLLALLLVAVPAVATALPSIPSSVFPSAEGCGCHAALFIEWQSTMHAKALSDPIFQAKLKQVDEETDGAVTPFCLGCHSPIGVMAGEVTTSDISRASKVAGEGVTCSFCHSVTATVEPLGNTSQEVASDGVRRAQLKDPQAPHAAAYSEFHESPEFCGSCHNVSHPGNGTHLEDTYTEWAESEYAKKGITCQDCHMTPGPGVTKPNPGKAAGMGPKRDHIFTMTFVGANVALGNAELAEANLKAAAELALEAPEIQTGQIPVKVTVTNVGAGHDLPTGLTEVRQMWLEVKATDASGKELLNERRDWGTVLEDANGNAPAEVWNAVAIKSDDRIGPKESSINEYAFEMAEGPVTVEATLYYRSAPEEVAQAVGIEIPTTTMASITKMVYTSAEQKGEAELGQTAGEGGDDSKGGMSPLVIVAVLAVVALAILGFVLARRGKAKA